MRENLPGAGFCLGLRHPERSCVAVDDVGEAVEVQVWPQLKSHVGCRDVVHLQLSVPDDAHA